LAGPLSSRPLGGWRAHLLGLQRGCHLTWMHALGTKKRLTFDLADKEPSVTIRGRRTAESLFLLFSLVFVIPVMEVLLVSTALSDQGDIWSTVFAYVIFPALGVISAYSLMWQHAGEEIIKVTGLDLRVRRRIYGRGNEYCLGNVDPGSLQLSATHDLRRVSWLMFWGLPWQRAIQLRSDGRRKLIGNDLSAEEAEEVITFLRRYLRGHAHASPSP